MIERLKHRFLLWLWVKVQQWREPPKFRVALDVATKPRATRGPVPSSLIFADDTFTIGAL